MSGGRAEGDEFDREAVRDFIRRLLGKLQIRPDCPGMIIFFLTVPLCSPFSLTVFCPVVI